MLGRRLSGAMFSENFGDLAQLIGFNFEGIPSDYRQAILDVRPENPVETDRLISLGDGLQLVPEFANKWTTSSSLSSAVDDLRSDPAAATLAKVEQGLSSQLMDALLRARNFYPWGNAFGRTPANQAGLNAALGQLISLTSQYLDQIPSMIKRTQTAIADRETAKNEAIQHEAELQAKTASASTAEQESRRATAQSSAFTAQTTELKSKLEYEKLERKSQQTLIFGMPLSIVAPVGLAAAVGLFLVTRRKSSGPMSGYRRSNPSARRSRKVRRR